MPTNPSRFPQFFQATAKTAYFATEILTGLGHYRVPGCKKASLQGFRFQAGPVNRAHRVPWNQTPFAPALLITRSIRKHFRASAQSQKSCILHEKKSFRLLIMVGESETVSRTFSAAVNGAIWVGGFLAIFVTIFVIATTSDTLRGTSGDRSRPRTIPRNAIPGNSEMPIGAEEPSMGLSPAVIQ